MLDNVIDFLISQDRARFDTSHKEIYMRCVFCSDPKSNTSANLVVKVGVDAGEPLVYQCFRAECRASGYLDVPIIQRHFHCNDMRVILELSKHNMKLEKKKNKFVKKAKKDLELVNLKKDMNKIKLAYINDRLELDLSHKDLKKLKIQLDLVDMLKLNNIDKTSETKSKTQFISDNSIGFISIFNEYLICRFINKNSNIRYLNYSLYPDEKLNNDPSKIYVIPTDINLLSPHSTTLRLAEGAITLLGVYFNVEPYKNRGDEIYAANCGSGYYKTISTLCKHYALTNINIEIYSDSEIKIDYYKNLLKRLKDEVLINSFNVNYNILKEDFGHKKNNIKLRSEKLI